MPLNYRCSRDPQHINLRVLKMTWLCMRALQPAHAASLIAHTHSVHGMERSLSILNTSVLIQVASGCMYSLDCGAGL